MKNIIVTTPEDLIEIIDLAVSIRINPIHELIKSKLNPQKKNVTVKEAAKD